MESKKFSNFKNIYRSCGDDEELFCKKVVELLILKKSDMSIKDIANRIHSARFSIENNNYSVTFQFHADRD